MSRSDVSDVRDIASDYVAAFSRLLARLDVDSIERVVSCLRSARDCGAGVYIAGNGGSAATASHWANDLGKAVKRSKCRPIRVLSLSDNVSWLTALGNDEGYERVFAGQLENFATAGDVLVVISASGNSPNLLRAVELAHALGATTAALLGFDGGALLGMVEHPVLVETELGAYGLVETAHSLVADLITSCLMRDNAPA